MLSVFAYKISPFVIVAIQGGTSEITYRGFDTKMFSRHGNDPTRIEVRKNVAGLAI